MNLKLSKQSDEIKYQIKEIKREFDEIGFIPPDEESTRDDNIRYIIDEDIDKAVGIMSIREHLTDDLDKFGGQVGMEIRPSERNKGYGTEALKQSLKIFKQMGLTRVLVTCCADNIASRKAITNNKGVLYNTVMEGNDLIQRYWIEVT
jgi:predicted acetyltransferase